MKAQTKISISILSVLFIVSVAFTGAATVTPLTPEQASAISDSFNSCRSIKTWPRAKTSDEDVCSCVQWHVSDLVPRTDKFKLDLFQKRLSEAAQKKVHPIGGFKPMNNFFTQDMMERMFFVCEENPAMKYSFPL